MCVDLKDTVLNRRSLGYLFDKTGDTGMRSNLQTQPDATKSFSHDDLVDTEPAISGERCETEARNILSALDQFSDMGAEANIEGGESSSDHHSISTAGM